jgi:hypothetical protein
MFFNSNEARLFARSKIKVAGNGLELNPSGCS